MEIIKGTIESVETKAGVNEQTSKGWTRWSFKINGKNYSTFNADIGDKFKAGNAVQISGEQPEGSKYWNMKTMELIPEDEVVKVVKPYEQVKEKSKEYHLSPEEVRCRALEIATSWKQDNSMAIYETAELIVKWILK